MKQSAFVPLLLPAHNSGLSPLSFVAARTPSVRPAPGVGHWVNRIHQNMSEVGQVKLHNGKVATCHPSNGASANLIDLNKESCAPTNNCNVFAATPSPPPRSHCSLAPMLNYKTAIASLNSWSDHPPTDV